MELAVENGIRVINPELQELKKELEQRRAEAGRRQISAKKARQEGDPQDVRAQPWELKRNWHEMTEWEQLTTEQENLERERKRLKETPEHERLSPEAAEKMLDDATRILADPKLEEYQRKLDEKRSELEAEYSKREKEYQELLKARPIQSLKERMFQSRYEQRLKEWKGQVQEGEERLQEARDMIDQHDAEVSSWEWKGKWFVQRDARKEAQFYNPMAVVVLQEEAKRRAQEQAQKRLEIEAIEKAESERKKIEAAARTAEAEARAKEDTEHERLRADAKAREKQEYRNRLEEERKIMRREAVKLIVNKFDESSLDDSPRRIVEYDSPNLDRDNRLRVGEIVGIVRHDEVPFVYVAQIIRHEGQEYGALFKVDGKISREVKEGSTLSLNMESDGGLSAMTPRELERFLERSRGLSR
jgi:hypothetical protein